MALLPIGKKWLERELSPQPKTYTFSAGAVRKNSALACPGTGSPGALVVDTLVAMMPVGLTRRPRAPIDALGVVETWD